MPWPSDQDYNEAIQNPRIAFADPELQSGLVEVNKMGIPKARSGNFATVYKVTVNGTSHAVRCFRYDDPEHNIRYPAIASYLMQNSLPYMVPFLYMPEGIRVGPSRYPFVRMQWIGGDSLVAYVEKNLSSPKALRELAAAWAQMLTDLRQAKIAHGDLQHGNVLVVQGKLRLVDYDGMYVPALNGSRGIELGHSNYQHPQRTALDFGPHLDNFSAWLIYVSLLALAAQPALWAQLKGGDECLLFRKPDFDAPERSAAFRLLKGLPDAQVRGLADRLEHFLWLPPDQVPAVDDREDPSGSAARSDSSRPPAASWIQDYTKQFAEQAASEFPTIEVGDPTWLQDHVEQKLDLGSFTNNVMTDRVIALLLFATAGALCAWLAHGAALPIAIIAWLGGISAATLLTIASWLVRYRSEPLFPAVHALQSELASATKDREAANHVFEELKAKRLRRRASFTEDGTRLTKRELALQADEEKRLRDIDAVLQTALEQATGRRRTATAEEGAEKRKLAETIGGEISGLSHALSALPDRERQELARLDSEIGGRVKALASQIQEMTGRLDVELAAALAEYQYQVVNSHLHTIRLSDSKILLLTAQNKLRLAEAGFFTAGDIGTRECKVQGIGPKKWAALEGWRRELEGQIRMQEAPKILLPHMRAAIEGRYGAQIKRLQQNLGQEHANLRVARQDTTTRIADQKRTLEQRKATAESNLRQQASAIEKKFNDQRRQIAPTRRLPATASKGRRGLPKRVPRRRCPAG